MNLQNEATKVVCAIFCNAEGELLLFQRKQNQKNALQWEFPGGKIEDGESPKDALRRELQEELGIKTKVLIQQPSVFHIYPHINIELIPFYCDGPIEKIHLKVHQAMEWCTPQKAFTFKVSLADRKILQNIIDSLGNIT